MAGTCWSLQSGLQTAQAHLQEATSPAGKVNRKPSVGLQETGNAATRAIRHIHKKPLSQQQQQKQWNAAAGVAAAASVAAADNTDR